jgi:hypothetical protein
MGDFSQFFGKNYLRGIVKISPRHVDQFSGLVPDGLDDFGVTVPGRVDGYTGGKIQEFISVNILDP